MTRRCAACFLAAVAFWISDKFGCDVTSRCGLYHLHAVWHLLIAIASYQVLVVFAYYLAAKRNDVQAVLQTWPSEDWTRLGVSYVTFRHFDDIEYLRTDYIDCYSSGNTNNLSNRVR